MNGASRRKHKTYGQIPTERRPDKAHRHSWQLLKYVRFYGDRWLDI